MKKTINLLPKPEQREIALELVVHQVRNFWIWIILSLMVLFGLGFLTRAKLAVSISGTKQAIESSKSELSSASTQQLEQQVLKLTNEINNVENIRSQHYYWSKGLIELADILPSDFLLNTLTLNRKTGQVAVSGVAGDRENILKFWSDMHKSKLFRDINFPLSNLEKAKEAGFSFSFYIKDSLITKE